MLMDGTHQVVTILWNTTDSYLGKDSSTVLDLSLAGLVISSKVTSMLSEFLHLGCYWIIVIAQVLPFPTSNNTYTNPVFDCLQF